MPRDLLRPKLRALPYFLVYLCMSSDGGGSEEAGFTSRCGGAMRRGGVPELRERRLGRSERDSAEL